MGLARDRALQSFFLAGIARQIWLDSKLLRAPVAQVFEQRDQCLAGGAERIGDLGRRGAHCRSSDDAVLFQFTELRGENPCADASEKIAEFGEAARAKRKVPDRLDFPLAAQDIDGGLNGTAVVTFLGGGSRLTNLCALHRGTAPLYHVLEAFGSRESP